MKVGATLSVCPGTVSVVRCVCIIGDHCPELESHSPLQCCEMEH